MILAPVWSLILMLSSDDQPRVHRRGHGRPQAVGREPALGRGRAEAARGQSHQRAGDEGPGGERVRQDDIWHIQAQGPGVASRSMSDEGHVVVRMVTTLPQVDLSRI